MPLAQYSTWSSRLDTKSPTRDCRGRETGFRGDRSRRLEQLLDPLAEGEDREGAPGAIVVFRADVHAEMVVHGGEDILRVLGVVFRVRAFLVARSDHAPAL